MSPIRALIIEDNAAARAGLRESLKSHPDVAVVGEAGTVGRARTLLALNDYDLVFMRYNKVLSFNETDQTITVQTGL